MGIKKKKRMTGVEPASSAWEADILPMYYICAPIYSNMFSEKINAFHKNALVNFVKNSEVRWIRLIYGKKNVKKAGFDIRKAVRDHAFEAF